MSEYKEDLVSYLLKVTVKDILIIISKIGLCNFSSNSTRNLYE